MVWGIRIFQILFYLNLIYLSKFFYFNPTMVKDKNKNKKKELSDINYYTFGLFKNNSTYAACGKFSSLSSYTLPFRDYVKDPRKYINNAINKTTKNKRRDIMDLKLTEKMKNEKFIKKRLIKRTKFRQNKESKLVTKLLANFYQKLKNGVIIKHFYNLKVCGSCNKTRHTQIEYAYATNCCIKKTEINFFPKKYYPLCETCVTLNLPKTYIYTNKKMLPYYYHQNKLKPCCVICHQHLCSFKNLKMIGCRQFCKINNELIKANKKSKLLAYQCLNSKINIWIIQEIFKYICFL